MSYVHINPDDKKFSIAIAGPKAEVRQVATKVHDITKKLEKELNLRRTSIKEPMRAFKKWQIELFGLKGLEKRLLGMFEDVSIQLNPAEKTILLEGPTSEISIVKIKIYEEIGKFQTKTKEVSSLLAEVAGSKEVMADIKQSVAHPAQAVIEVQGTQIQVHAATKEDALKVLAAADRKVCEEHVSLDTDELEGLQSANFKTFCTNHETANNGKVKMNFVADKQVIRLCCTSNKRDEMLQAIKDFLRKNTFHTAHVEMDYGKLRLLDIHQREELQQLSAKLSDGQVNAIPLLFSYMS